MNLSFPTPPSALRDRLEVRPFEITERRFGFVFNPPPKAVVGAHQAFVVRADALKDTDSISPVAVFMGWRGILQPDLGEAFAELYDAGADLLEINRGPFTTATWAAVGEIENFENGENAPFEFRFLTIPALYVAAIWIFGVDRSLFFVLPPAPSAIPPGFYEEAALLRVLKHQAEKRQGMPP